MKNAFDWLVRHEKLVIVVTAVLVVALGVRTYFTVRTLTVKTHAAHPLAMRCSFR